MYSEPPRTLESELPPEFIEWAAYCAPSGSRVASTLEDAITRLRFGNEDFLIDAVTAWRRHTTESYDDKEPPATTRSRLQTKFIQTIQIVPLPGVPEEYCKRIMTIATNYAAQGMSMKSNKDKLLHRWIERTLRPDVLAGIPYTQGPYEANASNPEAERIIKEITTDREHVDIIKSCEPSTSHSDALTLLVYTTLSELWNGDAPECHVNTNAATADRLCLCVFTDMMSGMDINAGLFSPEEHTMYMTDGLFPIPSLMYHMIRMGGEVQLLSIVEGKPDSASYAAARYAIES